MAKRAPSEGSECRWPLHTFLEISSLPGTPSPHKPLVTVPPGLRYALENEGQVHGTADWTMEEAALTSAAEPIWDHGAVVSGATGQNDT